MHVEHFAPSGSLLVLPKEPWVYALFSVRSLVNISLDGKKFRSVANTPNGEVSADTLFNFRQEGRLVTGTYEGGEIVQGQLLAVMGDGGELDMRYHHINRDGEFMLGKCLSTPDVLPDGRIKYHERWQWLSGDMSSGESAIEETPKA